MKKFEFSVQAEGDAFVVYRGAEPLKTPRNLPVSVPTRRLADAIVSECAAQDEKMDLRKMPLTQMALTSIDIAANHRDDVVNGIMRYGDTELLCQRAIDPAELVEEQNRLWQPLLDWTAERFKAKLNTGSGIVPFEQSKEALAVLKTYISSLDAFILTGVSEAASLSGSLVLSLALLNGRLNAQEVLSLAELDQIWQNKKWGEDPAVQSRHNDILKDLTMCGQWFSLLS